MTTHLRFANHSGSGGTLCGLDLGEGDEVIDKAEAFNPVGRHFDCVDCHRVLTLDRKHVPPPEDKAPDEVVDG